jgi:WD40 repeat protein
VVTTSWDMAACVWNLQTGEGVWSLEGHTDLITMAVISENDQWVVTSSQDGTSRVWDIQKGLCTQVG